MMLVPVGPTLVELPKPEVWETRQLLVAPDASITLTEEPYEAVLVSDPLKLEIGGEVALVPTGPIVDTLAGGQKYPRQAVGEGVVDSGPTGKTVPDGNGCEAVSVWLSHRSAICP